VEFYFGSADADLNSRRFAAVLSSKQIIETVANRQLEWEPLEGKKAARISTYGIPGADVENTQDWPNYIDWFVGAYRDMRLVASAEFVETIRSSGK
jgi:hypothetical protein